MSANIVDYEIGHGHMKIILTAIITLVIPLFSVLSHAEDRFQLFENPQTGQLYIEIDKCGRVKGLDGEMHEVDPDFYQNLGKKYVVDSVQPPAKSNHSKSVRGPKIRKWR